MEIGGYMIIDPYKTATRFDLFENVQSPDLGLARLKELFPDAEADTDNFALFSTAGTFGSRTTIEEIENSLLQYGANYDGCEPADWFPPHLTVVVMKPRLLMLQYGVVQVSLDNIDYMKRLRQSSHEAIAKIGH
jgi:hypothetical protein